MKNQPDPAAGKKRSKRPAAAAGKSDRRKRTTARKPAQGAAPESVPESPKAQPSRLHKIMAAAGLGSRRTLEQHIRSGEIMLNGERAGLGQTVKPGDQLQWGDKEWRVVADLSQHRTLIYNKPEGEITSRSDPEGRTTVFDRLPYLKNARWVAVGRLDINTTGLLLLTTDGELANAMMHPSNQVDREYVCRVRGLVSDEQVEQLKTGVELDDGPAHFNDVRRMGGPDAGAYGKPDGKTLRHQSAPDPSRAGANQWFQVTLLEGRNREVRRLWEALGYMVSRLKRVRYGAAMLPKGLKVGQWHEISAREHQVLRTDVNLAAAQPELVLQPVGLPAPERVGRHGKGGRPGNKPGGRRTGQGRHTTRSADVAKPRKHAGRKATDPVRGPREKPAGKPRISKPGSPAGGGRRPAGKSRSSKS